MQAKVFEIIDSGCSYSVLAVLNSGDTPLEQSILNKVGLTDKSPYKLQLTDLHSGETQRDKFKWNTYGRTFREAHSFIAKHWSKLSNGDAIDVRVIVGELAPASLEQRMGA